MKKYLTTLYLIILSFSNFYSSGFQINEQGSRAMGLGGAFTGLANDPSAIYFNPAGITQLYGTHFIGGATLILPSSTFRGPYPSISETKMESQVFNPIHLYATHQVFDKFFLGVGVGNNYGLGTKWDENWVGRFMTVQTEIRTFFFNAVASYKIMEEVSVGFGYVFAYGDVLINRKINLTPFNSEPSLNLEGTGYGAGFTAGIFVHPIKAISLGLSFRSQVKFDFEGDAIPSEYSSQFEGLLPNGKITAPLTTPQNITLGVAIRPLNNFTLTADYQYVGWDSYDKLEVQFEEFIDSETGELLVSTSDRLYDNGFIARIGAEYNYSKSLAVRGGFLYDRNPVSDERLDPTLPDSDRLGFNFGGTLNLNENIALEAAYMFLRFDEREITNSAENYSGIENSISPMNGMYNSIAHLFSVTLAYKF
ncbi:MAG: outer membrane protein transport protein [Ignavibacteriae bacterium]|nr:outer membrane protein transport protein [Ignavibacteriota bacterium]